MDQAPTDLQRFLACWPLTLAQECPLPNDWGNPRNFSDDAHDPGGETMCGITQREYDHYRTSQALHVQTVRLITRAEGQDIYDRSYWLPYCPDLPQGLDLSFFDSAVNEGVHEAVKILQASLDLATDGAWGPKTALAVRGILDAGATIKRFTARRETVYRELRGYPYFGKDWERRATEIGAAALKMVQS